MEWMLKPLKRYAEFSGRSRRMEYWMFQLFMFLVYLTVVILMMMVGGSALMSGDPTAIATAGGAAMILGLIYLVFALAMFIPSLAVTVRRLHDTNRSGWWILAPIIPYILMVIGAGMMASSPDNPGLGGVLSMIGLVGVLGLGITLFVFMVLDGTKGPNRFGPDPKGVETGEVFA